ncbi:MAG: peptide MFS transporter [Elusimicrobia bacterium]|nr:peptide MFS transporter [Elusimicrobiota bacterium]
MTVVEQAAVVSVPETGVGATGDLWGHPKGLYVLFFTELWERFSFYGMQAILVYYMVKHLMFTQEKASWVWGWYSGSVYLTPFFGGLLADKYLGQRKTVIIGGVLMAIGHFMMAVESLFYPAMIFLIFGCGALKPNISTQVGSLYHEHDHRRDRAFNIFYLGINIGAFLSPLICGTLGEKLGWHYGFAMAGVGMIIGLIVYIWGQKHLAPDELMKARAAHTEHAPLTAEEKKRLWALFTLCALNILFWVAYEQQGNTMALWADQNTNRHILGRSWEMPASWFQAVNPAFMFVMTPLLCWLWAWQAKRKTEPSSISKMVIGCVALGAAFLPMAFIARCTPTGSLVSSGWLVGSLFFVTIGELYLSPIGLSVVTKLSPPRLVSRMMGLWFLSWFAGGYLAGYVGTFWEKMSKDHFFMMLAGMSFVAGLSIFLVAKPIHRAIGNIDE